MPIFSEQDFMKETTPVGNIMTSDEFNAMPATSGNIMSEQDFMKSDMVSVNRSNLNDLNANNVPVRQQNQFEPTVPANITLAPESTQSWQGTPVAPGMPTKGREVSPMGLNERGQAVLLSPETLYKGIPEAAASTATGIAGFFAKGIYQPINALALTIEGHPDPVGAAKKTGEKIAEWMTYQPESASGKELAGFAGGVMNVPFEAIRTGLEATKMPQQYQDAVMEGILSGLAIAGTAKMAKIQPKTTVPEVPGRVNLKELTEETPKEPIPPLPTEEPIPPTAAGLPVEPPAPVEGLKLAPTQEPSVAEKPQLVKTPVPLTFEENNTYQGKRETPNMAPGEVQLVAFDATGNEVGRIRIKPPEGETTLDGQSGFLVSKIDTVPKLQKQGIGEQLLDKAVEQYGPRLGSTGKTPEGEAFIKRYYEKRGMTPPEENVPQRTIEKSLTEQGISGNVPLKQEVQSGAIIDMQMRENASAWSKELPGLSQRVYEGMAKQSPADLGAAEKVKLQELRTRISETGEDTATAMRELWGPELTGSPRELRQTLIDSLAMQKVPPGTSQPVRWQDQPIEKQAKGEPIGIVDKLTAAYKRSGLSGESGTQELYAFPANLTKYIPGAKSLQEAYERPPQFTESKKIIGQYTGAIQVLEFKLTKLAREINKEIQKDRQEAITNYMQAGGDAKLLSQRAKLGKSDYRKGYENALKLTPEEKQWANAFRKKMDDTWQQANDAGILEDYVSNYVRGEWERPDKAGKNLLAQVNAGIFRKNPREALHKVFQDYFEGEQAGFKPKNKQIGYQLIAAERSIMAAVETRKALRNMLGSTMPDGRPMVSVGGAGSMLKEGEPQAYFVKPNVKGKDTGDYKFIDHPSLRKWKWIENDTEGKPIMMEGNMWIHPDAFPQVNALLGKSWIRTYTVPERIPVIGGTQPGRAALEAGAFVKGTILLGPFHQFHVGEHAVFHKVNPFNTKPIDFDTRPLLREGVDHGLMLYNHNALVEFGEGLASGGLFHRIPIIKEPLKRYQEYLFQDYIPRLKAAMFEHAVERAEKYYAKELKSGKFTRDQLLDNAAKQANAAFGELNYKYIGRNPAFQDTLRLGLLAPDFLEARLKFAGQAMRPYGKEQAMALIRGAIIMSTTAQALNVLFGDDHKMHWDKPFSFIYGGREYTPRSVVADIGHLIMDPRSFWYHRLNPLWGRPVYQLMTSKNQYGQKVDFEDNAKELLKSVIPIPLQGTVKKNMGENAVDSTINSLLTSVGVSNYPYKTKAERMISDAIFSHMRVGAKTDREKVKYQFTQDMRDKVKSGEISSAKEIRDAASDANILLTPKTINGILNEPIKEAKLTDKFKMLTIDEAAKVWDVSSEDEKDTLRRTMMLKISNAKITGQEKRDLREKIQ